MAMEMRDQVGTRRDRLRGERFRHPRRGLLGPDHRGEVARGVDLVHDDHVALVVLRELERAAEHPAVIGKQPVARRVFQEDDGL